MTRTVAAVVVAAFVVPGSVVVTVIASLMVPGPVAAPVVASLVVPEVAYRRLVVGGPVVAVVVHATYGRVVCRVGSVRGDGQRDRDAGATEDGRRRESDEGSGPDAAHGHSRDRTFEVTFVPYLRYVMSAVRETIALWSYDLRSEATASGAAQARRKATLRASTSARTNVTLTG